MPPASKPSAQFDFGMQLAAAPSDFQIPAVKDRPLSFDPASGPRFEVSTITPVEVVVVGGSTRQMPINDAGLRALIDKAISEQNGEFTFGLLQELANAMTVYLREQDNLLATAYVPSQEVENGSVRIDVLMGKLGEVQVQGNKRFDEGQIANAFDRSLGNNVNRERIEESMLLLQEYPGLSVGGTFYPGSRLGESRLVINVNEEDRFEAIVLGDNYGSDFTGRNRVGVHMEFNNPFGLTDKLTSDLVVVETPEQLQVDDSLADRAYGSFRYELNPFSPRWGFGISANKNNYAVGNVGTELISRLEVTGETQQVRGFVTGKSRSRSTKLDWEVGLTKLEAETLARGAVSARDELSTIDAGFRLEHNDSIFGGGVNFLNVRMVQGFNFLGSMGEGTEARDVPSSRIVQIPAFATDCLTAGIPGCNPTGTVPASQKNADAEFFKVEYSYQRFQPAPLANVLFTVNGQYTKDPLTTVQQAGLGGPYSVRAYPTALYQADKSLYAGIEFIRPFYDNRFSLSAFYDYATGENFDTFANENPRVSLRGLGLGARWNVWSELNLNLTVAWALDDDSDIPVTGEVLPGTTTRVFGTGSEDLDEPMVYFSLYYGI